jgi:hypothetical protein
MIENIPFMLRLSKHEVPFFTSLLDYAYKGTLLD